MERLNRRLAEAAAALAALDELAWKSDRTLVERDSAVRLLVLRFSRKFTAASAFIVFPAKGRIYVSDGHRPEPVLGPAKGRTRGPV